MVALERLLEEPDVLLPTETWSALTSLHCSYQGLSSIAHVKAASWTPQVDWAAMSRYQRALSQQFSLHSPANQKSFLEAATAHLEELQIGASNLLKPEDNAMDFPKPTSEQEAIQMVQKCNLEPPFNPHTLHFLFPLLSERLLEQVLPDPTIEEVVRLVGRLPRSAKDVLCVWYGFYVPLKHMRNHLQVVQWLLLNRVANVGNTKDGLMALVDGSASFIRCCLQFMQILYHANLIRDYRWNERFHRVLDPPDGQMAPLEMYEFYNEALTEGDPVINLEFKLTLGPLMHSDRVRPDTDLSLFRYPFVLNAVIKSNWLHASLSINQMQESGRDAVLYGPFSIVRPYYEIAVRRQHLLHDALTKLLVSSDALRKELRVRFIGEEGVDQGGVRKEFLQLLVQELFHASYGMYKRYNNDRFYYFTAEFAGQHENGIRMYQLCGVVIGLALYNHTILDVHFPLAVYRKLLGHRCGLLDLAEYMPEVAKSIHNVRNASAAELDMMGLTFAVSDPHFGTVRDIALKDTVDKETLVTAANRDEYCDLLIDWYLHKSVEELFAAFKSGFEAIVMTDAYRLLNLHPIELRDLICGVDQEIDVHALRQSAKFQDGYTADSTTVLDFWQVLAELDQKQLRKFLWFLTGSDRIPVGGTSKIVITLGRAGPDSNFLPTAHTCFDFLLLPDYQNKGKLRERLLIAIENAQGFGLK